MSDPDQELEEERERHLFTAMQMMKKQYQEWARSDIYSKPKSVLLYSTTDGGKFTVKSEAIKHQYNLNRGLI